MTNPFLPSEEKALARSSLKQGDSIFICAPNVSLLDYTSITFQIVQEMGLVPVLYAGLVAPGKGLISSQIVEAEADLAKSHALFVLPVLSVEGEMLGRYWTTALREAAMLGIQRFVYFLLSDKETKISELAEDLIIPMGTKIRNASNPKFFSEQFRRDILLLMNRKE